MRQITIHLAVWGFAEFAFCLTRMNADMMYLHLDSGFLNVSYYKFDTDDVSGITTVSVIAELFRIKTKLCYDFLLI